MNSPHLAATCPIMATRLFFCTIGDASTSEGVFWETVNAAGVLQAPLAISVWDDGYGISVPKKYQTTKENISQVLGGFAGENGLDIYVGKAWDYPGLCKLYTESVAAMRQTHRPALLHIQEVTQQLGHSTSGDHRRYKSPERLAFEEEFDCNKRMADWMVASGIATEQEIAAVKAEAKKTATDAAQRAFRHYHDAVAAQRQMLNIALQAVCAAHPEVSALAELAADLEKCATRCALNY
ncbi:MAG: hypothetical protein IPM98_11270 [Lewinellaceae bacterium]|nr:hypothetical protein [Lewinellaceae bacterium]